MNRYGISLEDYKVLFSNQNGQCAICKVDQGDLVKALAVDHNHETGKVRGLLCEDCNKGLGMFDDNPSLIQRAAEYVKDFTIGTNWYQTH